MQRAVLVLAFAAVTVAALDLAHKALAIAAGGDVSAHERSVPYVLGIAVASALWTVAIALTRSRAIALGGGVLVGGAAANLLSLALWPGVAGIPNPLELPLGDATLAFNLADVCAPAGLALVLASTLWVGIRRRDVLSEPVTLPSRSSRRTA